MTRASKPTEASCTFDRVEVQLGNHGRTNTMQPPSNTTIVVEPKTLHLCGKYKLTWKKVHSLEVMKDGFMMHSEGHNVSVVGPHMNADWQDCSKLLQKFWNKQQRKREKQSQKAKQQEEDQRKAKRTYGNRNRYYSSSSTWKSKTAKFLAANENRNDWSSDDEETFNLERPKRKPLEEEEEEQEEEQETTAVDDVMEEEQATDAASTQGEDETMMEEHQEQAMEDAAADAELAERQKEEEEQDSEEEEEEVPKPKRKKFKRKRVRDDDDDSDDDMFGAAMTTPNPTSRTVSPNTLAKNRFADDDDEEDDMPSKATTKTTKTAPIAAFFQPPKKTMAKKEEETTPAPPSVKRNATTSSFFAPRTTKAAAANSPAQEMEEDTVAASQVSTVAASQASTIIPSQTPTVAASQLEDDEHNDEESPAMDSTTTPSTPKRKLEFSRHFGSSSSKTMEEEDPIVDTPPTSPVRGRTNRRKPMLHRRTYGSADKATRALEMANANHSPRRRNLALALSPGRHRKRDHYSPIRSPIRNANSPNRLLPMPDFRGIKNIGNTCYMNASLQMLFSVPSFLQQLACGKIPEHSIVSSLVDLFQDLQDQQRAPGSARNLKMAVDEKTTKFQGYQQRDANEFLGDLLDTLHDELVGADKKEEEKENEPPTTETKDKKKIVHPTDNFFRLDVEVCLKCKSCGYSRTKEEMYRYLSLDIVQKEGEEVTKPNIEECLHAFFQPEDREIKCEKCEEGQVAEQTMKVLSRPKAILLHLKRFAMVEQPSKEDGGSPTFVLRKNKAPVELNQSLSLDPFFKVDETRAAAKQDYEIQSIVHHIGSSADSGHYTADALRDDPKDKGNKTWVSFDDTLVERLSEADVLQDKARRKTAYMMLYTVKS